jgi:hypothetical protein
MVGSGVAAVVMMIFGQFVGCIFLGQSVSKREEYYSLDTLERVIFGVDVG